MANKITLSIAGFNLIVNTNEDEERVRKLCATLNSDLQQVLSSNNGATVTNAALLCALDYLSRYDKATRSANNLRTQIKDYLADASAAKLQLDEQVKRNSELAAENQAIRSRLTKQAADDANEELMRRAVDSARSESETLRAQMKDLLEQAKSLAEKNEAMSGLLSTQEEQLRTLENSCREKENVIEKQKSELDARDQKLAASAAALSALGSRADNAESLVKTLTDRMEQLQSDYDVLSELATQAEAERSEMKAKLGKATDELEQLKAAKAETSAAAAAVADSLPSFDLDLFSDDSILEDTADEDEDTEDGDGFRSITDFEPISLDDDDFSGLDDDADLLAKLPELPEELKEAMNSDFEFPDFGEDEFGVGDDFKTFGQMIAEEKGISRASEIHTPFNAAPVETTPVPSPTFVLDSEDDDLPNLSWINDI